MNEQPDEATKLSTLAGERTGWDYRFNPPPIPTGGWSFQDWINHIGDNWFRNSESPKAKGY